MTTKRRTLLKGALASSAAAVAAGAGILTPRALFAAWPQAAFEARNVDDALNGLGGANATPSDEINIKAPDIAENGAVVPVTVSTTLANVESISIVASKNNQPLTSTYMLPAGTQAFVSTRIKMASTSDVIALVTAGGNVYSASKEVKVTIGGCGG